MNAVERIKNAGFTHLKVELEADLDRDGCETDCYECYSGQVDCSQCGGDGYEACFCEEGIIETPQGEADCEDCDGQGYTECQECYGSGSTTCYECDGDGYTSEMYTDTYCEEFLNNYVGHDKAKLNYGQFYNDGSVDSEFTFTLPVEDAHIVIDYIEAFNALADEIGNGLGVGGAGMHISVMTQGEYPVSHQLEPVKIRNFKREVSKLLPALFFLASSNHTSRPLEYRLPRVSSDDKYSAIYTRDDTIIEYRLFETCYERPQAFFEYLEVIASTLKYYADARLSVRDSLRFEWGDRFEYDGGAIGQLYDTPDKLEALDSLVKYVEVSKDAKTLKRERGIKHTADSLKIRQIKKQCAKDQLRMAQRIEHQKWIKRNAMYEQLKQRNRVANAAI